MFCFVYTPEFLSSCGLPSTPPRAAHVVATLLLPRPHVGHWWCRRRVGRGLARVRVGESREEEEVFFFFRWSTRPTTTTHAGASCVGWCSVPPFTRPPPTEDLGSGVLDRGTKARGTCVSGTCARCRSSDPDLGRTQTRSARNGRASLSSFLPPTPAVRDELIGGGGLSVPLLNSDRTHREHV